MSLLNLRTKKEKADVPATKKLAVKEAAVSPSLIPRDASTTAILCAHITEKATFLDKQGTYIFLISPKATKKEVAIAIQALYKVFPRKISIVPMWAKKVVIRGKRGVRSGGKKAYVNLKKGEKIEVA